MPPLRHIPHERAPDATPTRPLWPDETKFAAGKIAVFQYVTVGVFLFLLAGFWELQVRNESFYNERAQRNFIKSQPIPAPRGKLLDRDERVIVDNHASYALILSRENLREEHLRPIAEGLNLEVQDLAGWLRRVRTQPKYVPLRVKNDLTPQELTFVEANRGAEAFPEMELIKSQQRLYPREGMAAHMIGYVGEVNEAELNSAEWGKYNPGDIIGKFGIERFYNDMLTGVDGQRQVRVDVSGRERKELGYKEAVPGKDLRLTIDLDLQAVAELAMQDRRGAVVALDPRTGEVLAMVSRPAFDPNLFTGRINPRDWNRLNTDPASPFMNRAIQAQLAPGSTFKPIVALAALESGVVDENFSVFCPGYANWYGRQFKCHVYGKGGHGNVSLHRAMALSCDVYFYAVGNKLGIDKIAEYAEMAGFGRKTGIDLPQEKDGILPSSKWKIRTQREKWYAGETISVAIGQGALTSTPLQLAYAIGGLATGGVWMRPHLTKDHESKEPARKAELNIDNVNKVIAGMCAVVNEGGTAGASRLNGIEMCGKTGSAQPVSTELQKAKKGEYKDNAWFVGFAPRNSPEIVVAALFEQGEHGNLAAPIVRDVVKSYFDKKARKERGAGQSVAVLR